MKKITVILLTIGILLSSLTLPTYEDESKEMLRTSTTYSIDCDGPLPTNDGN